MASKERLTIDIQPLQYADISTCARITAAAFSTDRHTLVKQLGGKPFDMYDVSCDGFLATLHRKNYVYVKAVNSIGNIVGHAGWGFRGVYEADIASEGPADRIEDHEQVKGTGNKSQDEGRVELGTNEEKAENGIDRLHALEDADMQHAMAWLMPPGTSCMYIIGLIVSPDFQSQGVGSALIEFGNAIADRLGIFTWVHSSDQAWKAYAKLGFETVKELPVDLDEYAPSPPGKTLAERLEGTGEGVTEHRWGEYTIRYMKRLPKGESR